MRSDHVNSHGILYIHSAWWASGLWGRHARQAISGWRGCTSELSEKHSRAYCVAFFCSYKRLASSEQPLISGPTLAFITHEWNVFNIGDSSHCSARPWKNALAESSPPESWANRAILAYAVWHSAALTVRRPGGLIMRKNAYPRETITPALSPTRTNLVHGYSLKSSRTSCNATKQMHSNTGGSVS